MPRKSGKGFGKKEEEEKRKRTTPKPKKRIAPKRPAAPTPAPRPWFKRRPVEPVEAREPEERRPPGPAAPPEFEWWRTPTVEAPYPEAPMMPMVSRPWERREPPWRFAAGAETGFTPEAARAMTQLIAPPGTRERIGGAIGEAWEAVGAPKEPWQLPGALQEASKAWRTTQEYAPERTEELVAAAEQGGEYGMLQEFTPEERAVAAERGRTVTGLTGKAWADIKQLPVAGKPARRAEALGTTLVVGLFQAPVMATQESLAVNIGQQLPAGQTLPPLTGPAEYLTEEQQALAQKVADAREMPLYIAQQYVLNQARQGKPSVRDYGINMYGEGEQIERALNLTGSACGYSSYDSQILCLDRVMAGEDIDVVAGGTKVDVRNFKDPNSEDLRIATLYADGVLAREGQEAYELACADVNSTGRIPGSSDLVNQLLFEIGLDPLNFFDVMQFFNPRIAGEVAAGRKYGEVVAQHHDDIMTGVEVAAKHGDDAAQGMAEILKRVNPLAPTRTAEALDQSNVAYQVTASLCHDATGADEAVALVGKFIDDPESLVPIFGNVPVSRAADQSRQVIALTAEDFTDAAKFPSLQAATFDPFEFANDMADSLIDHAMDITGAAAEKPNILTRFTQKTANVMSDIHLTSPGFAARQVVGDTTTMIYDDVMSLASRSEIDDWLARFGPTTRRVDGVAAGQFAGTSHLPSIAGVAAGKMKGWISRQEEARYLKAFYTSLQQYNDANWLPHIPDALRQLLTPEQATAIEAAWKTGVNRNEFVQGLDNVLGGMPGVNVSNYLDNANDLSPAMKAQLGVDLGKASSVDDIDEVIDAARGTVREHAAEIFASEPTPPGRRVWSDIEDAQDIAEEQGMIEGLGKAAGIPDEELARATTAMEDALRPGAIALHDADEAFAASVATGFDSDSAKLAQAVSANVMNSKMEERAIVDALLAQAFRDLSDGVPASQVWPKYFVSSEPVHLRKQAGQLQFTNDGLVQLDRLRAGESLEDVLGAPVTHVLDDAMESHRALLAEQVQRKEKLTRLGIEDFGTFDNRLDAQRLALDEAQAEAWRYLAVNPTRDGYDVMHSTQEGVDRLARATAASVAGARQKMLAGQITKAEFIEFADRKWTEFFAQATRGHDLAKFEVAQFPMSAAVQQGALQRLGWPIEEVGKLASDQVDLVLSAGVRWDPLMKKPVVSLDDAMRGTFIEVASPAGLNPSRSADWTDAEWTGFSDTAEALARQVDAAGIAKPVGAGSELTWPSNVDDVARSMGITPETATPEDWQRIAEYSQQQGVSVQMLGDEFGRRSTAAMEAERLPEWGQVGGQERVVRRGRLSFREEQLRVAELGREAAEAGAETMDWVLRQSGFSEDELVRLTVGQRQRLVEEIGQGKLLTTQAGKPSQIDAIAPDRRTELLAAVGTEIQEAAFGVALDPEAAVGYQWLQIADDANARAAGAGAPIGDVGSYDALGYPATPMSATSPEQQAYLIEQYANLGEMGKARAGLAQTPSSDIMDVPVGVTQATTRKEGGVYLLDLVDENNNVVKTYWAADWAEARKMRGEAREIIKSGTQGQAVIVGTSWAHYGTADVHAADVHAASVGGYAGGLNRADAVSVMERTEMTALDRIAEGAKADFGAEHLPVARETQQQLRQFVDDDLVRRWEQSRAVGVETARHRADFALLDYSKRTNADNIISMFFPYTYWRTRSARNWLIRTANKPGVFSHWLKYKEAEGRLHRESGLAARFRGKVKIPADWALPDWMGDEIYLPFDNPMPYSQLMGTDYGPSPSEGRNVIESMYFAGKKLGLTPHVPIDWILRATGIAGKTEEIRYVAPVTGAIKGITAMAGIGPPGGVSLEGGFRQLMPGVPEWDAWTGHAVMGTLSDISGDDPTLIDGVLRAQELARRIETEQLTIREATGYRDGGPSDTVAMIAREQRWTPEQLAEAQGLLTTAIQRAAQEKAVQQVPSYLAGVGASVLTTGERQQLEQQQQQRGAMYSPLTGEGSREEYLVSKEEHPEAAAYSVTRSGRPGAGEYSGWTPQQALQSKLFYEASDVIYADVDEQIDALIREQPWNTSAVSDLKRQRYDDVTALREEHGIEKADEYRARSVYGATPQEEGLIRREEILSVISGSLPDYDSFRDPETGEMDYDAYEAAQADFIANLQENLGDDERLAIIAEAMGVVDGGWPGQRRPATSTSLLEDVTMEDIEQYWRRNDSVLEAAQRIWKDEVYGAAWEAYNDAVDSGMDKSDAYEQFIESTAEVPAEQLAEQINAAYPERFTPEELEQLQGVTFPPVGEASTLRKPPEEQAMSRAQEAFWSFYNEQLPPGRMARGARDHTFIQLVLDKDTRGTATAEQYQEALKILEQWRADNYSDDWGTPEEWAEARELNDALSEVTKERWDNIIEVQGGYFDLPTAQRKAYLADHPELKEYWDFRKQYGVENPLWARYYLSGGAARATGAGGWAGAARGTGRKYYPRRRGGGGYRRKPRGEQDWMFARTAARPPKVYLETPSPWKSVLRQERYRAEGTPWLGKRWF